MMLINYGFLSAGIVSFSIGFSMIFTAIFHGYQKSTLDSSYMLWSIASMTVGLWSFLMAVAEMGLLPR